MILIVYDSCTGNTQSMAKSIAQGAQERGAEVILKLVDNATFDDLIKADAIIWGCPTYFGMMTAKMKKFVDQSNDIWGELDKKIGAAFTSSGGISGGNETALFSLIQAMLIHGMIVTSQPGRYGVVAIGKPDKKSLENCVKLGRRVASLLSI
jgi:NAD(P)H dehydrogenase (quinone)